MTQVEELRDIVWTYYAAHGRSMPWRLDHSPYRVLVSELMLQQTGVARVVPKFESFVTRFPDVAALARAPLADVLAAWQGLGYNRRARFLHEAARIIVRNGGRFPDTLDGLTALPGVGPNTAGAVLAYAFDRPAVFVETNLRTILFHHFFADRTDVTDRELEPLLRELLPDANYREWYWALMDYGAHLKATAGGRLDVSRHYKKQSPLKGSVREVRGLIIRSLVAGPLDEPALRHQAGDDERFGPALDGLLRDGLVSRAGDRWELTAA